MSAVWISATCLNIAISSGRLKNFEKRVFTRYPVPSGESSKADWVSPKVEAHASKCSKPDFFNSLYCKYRCMVYISVMELLIGVPVAKTIPFPPVISSIYLHFMYISELFTASDCPMPATFRILVWRNKFLNPCASSTKSLSTPNSSKVITSSFLKSSFSFSSLASSFFFVFSSCFTVKFWFLSCLYSST